MRRLYALLAVIATACLVVVSVALVFHLRYIPMMGNETIVVFDTWHNVWCGPKDAGQACPQVTPH